MEKIQERRAPIRRSKETIERLLMEWRQSGQSKILFCKENNINYLTFMSWANPPKKKNLEVKISPSSGFIPLKIKEQTSIFFVEVQLVDGTRIYFHESVTAAYLRSLVR